MAVSRALLAASAAASALALACASASPASSLGASAPLPVQFDAFGDNGIRMRIALPGCNITDPLYQGLLPTPPPPRGGGGGGGGTPYPPPSPSSSSLTNGNIRGDVDPATGYVTITRVSDGAVLMRQTGLTWWTPMPGNRPGVWAAMISFAGVNESEVIRGFGEQQDDQIAKSLPFVRVIEQAEYHAITGGSQILIPWFMSSGLYGALWNLPSYGNLTVDRAPGATSYVTQAAENIDMWFTTVPANATSTYSILGKPEPAYPKSVSATSPYAPLLLQLADATGHGLPMAPYAAGFIQCKDRYRNQTQFMDVLRGYFSRGIKVSLGIIDWFQ
jgi:alpha-glucosidase (family GH31 glycosyl hydrolase)